MECAPNLSAEGRATGNDEQVTIFVHARSLSDMSYTNTYAHISSIFPREKVNLIAASTTRICRDRGRQMSGNR
jgi:hypothetical protein